MKRLIIEIILVVLIVVLVVRDHRREVLSRGVYIEHDSTYVFHSK